MLRILSFAAAMFFNMAAAQAQVTSPNVLVILLDDARFDDLIRMPQARSIGAAGATFENAYSPFPLCCPARASLLTGQYSHNHGVQSNKRPTGGFFLFDGVKDDDTLATWLDPTYITGWVGKYLNEYGTPDPLTGIPTNRYIPPGWDHWIAPIGTFTNYTDTNWNRNRTPTRITGEYQVDTVARFTVDFIDDNANRAEPFFFVASFLAPHSGSPADPDDALAGGLPTPYVAPRHRNELANHPLSITPAFDQHSRFTQADIDALTEVNQQRRESLLFVEDALIDVFAALDANGVRDNTYIILVSDNGYILGEHSLKCCKNGPYDFHAKVPLLIQGPGIPAGCKVEQLVGIHDLAPTILAMTGNQGAQGSFVMDGVNLLPMCGNSAYHANRPIVIAGAPSDGQQAPNWTFKGIITPEWKVFRRYNNNDTVKKVELYDRVNDPWETQDRGRHPNFAGTRDSLLLRADRLHVCNGSGCWQ